MTEEEKKVVEESTEPKVDSLSNREALRVAVEKNQPEPVVEPKVETPTKTEVAAAVEADSEPPSSFSSEGKKAWREKNIKGIQKEYERIEKGRLAELTRVQNEKNTYEQKAREAEKLKEDVKTYLTLRGDSAPTDAQIAEAVQLVAELRKNKKVGKETLEKLFGPAEEGSAPQNNQELTSLRKDLDTLLSAERARFVSQTEQMFKSVFSNLNSSKTRTGELPYPWLSDEYAKTEEGSQFLNELGSLVANPQFQKGVQRRFPEADLSTVVREAYKYLGGKIADDSQTRVSKSDPKHIEKSRRAAASTPAGVVSRNGADDLIGKLSNRKALRKAIEVHERE